MRTREAERSFVRDETPLAVKASLPRTFRGLGVFVEVGLLFFGSYLLAEAALQPLDASSLSVVGGGVFLGLATVLLFYLAWPAKRKSISQSDEGEEPIAEQTIHVYGPAVERQHEANWVLEKKQTLPGPM